MKKAVLISIQPKWVRLIVSGEKTVEIRKTCPKLETPFKCYIYETKGHTWQNKNEPKMQDGCGMVVGEFVCCNIELYDVFQHDAEMLEDMRELSCVDKNDILKYAGDKPIYGWRISNVKPYYKPKRLSDFQLACNRKEDCCTCKRWNTKTFDCIAGMTRPPQSWCYVEELE